MPGLDSNRI